MLILNSKSISTMKKILSIIALAAVAVVSFVWALRAPGIQWFCGFVPMTASITRLCELIPNVVRRYRS